MQSINIIVRVYKQELFLFLRGNKFANSSEKVLTKISEFTVIQAIFCSCVVKTV